MAASDYDFNVTRTEVIERAFRLIGKLSVGETLSSEMSTQAILAMNAMIQSWQSENVFLWTLKATTLALTNGNASYSLSATDPLVYAIDRAYLRISNSDDPIQVGSFRQYTEIPNKTNSGDPTFVCLDHAISPTVYVWPVPTQSRTLYYLAIVRLKDFDTSAGNPDFPVRYINAITYGLAAELAPEYGLELQEQAKLESRAEREFLKAKRGERQREESDFVGGAYK